MGYDVYRHNRLPKLDSIDEVNVVLAKFLYRCRVIQKSASNNGQSVGVIEFCVIEYEVHQQYETT